MKILKRTNKNRINKNVTTSNIVYSKYSYACEALDIDVYFEFNDFIVFSTRKKTIAYDNLSCKKCKEILFITKCTIEKYNALTESARYYRGQILAIQGILSFFTGFPLTVYNNTEVSENKYTPFQYPQKDTYLRIDGYDFTSDLIKMLNRISEEPTLILTLLDRFRKALYLKTESHDADLYYDEAILNFFHILELFGECTSKELKNKLEKDIEKMLEKHFKSFYFNQSQINQMVNQNKKTINSILIGNYLNLSLKIKYFLEKYEMLDNNVSYFIDNMIKIRNSIAHGRITYQDKFIWPLSPFFNLAKDSYENISFLFFITATMISKYLGINCWLKEWEDVKIYLLPPKSIFEDFIDGKLIIENFDNSKLLNGNKYNITWRSVFNHYIKNPEQTFLEKIEAKLKKYFIELEINKEIGQDIFNISLIFADSNNNSIRDKAIDNIKKIIINGWYDWSNFKDAYSYLDFYGVNLKWYKEFLDNKEYLNLNKHPISK